MADDDAVRQRQMKELRQLRGQGGDGHHRRAVAEPDGDSGFARGTEPVERPSLRFEGKEGFVRDRPEGVLRVARKHRDDLLDSGNGDVAGRQTTNASGDGGIAADPQRNRQQQRQRQARRTRETPHRISEVTPRRHYAGRDARPVPPENGGSSSRAGLSGADFIEKTSGFADWSTGPERVVFGSGI